MNLFKGKLSATQMFGNIEHSNNNLQVDLEGGINNRYKQMKDVLYVAKVLKERINVSPVTIISLDKKYSINRKMDKVPEYTVIKLKEDELHL